MSYDYVRPDKNEIDNYFQNCHVGLRQKPNPPGLTMDAVLKTIGTVPTIELPIYDSSVVELYHVNEHRHWRWFDDMDAWSRTYLEKQKRCAQGFWFSMDRVASLGQTYRKSDKPLVKFKVTRSLKLLNLTENVDERRREWEKLVNTIKTDASSVNPNAPWMPLVDYNNATYGKANVQGVFGRLMGSEGRVYPDYYQWFWMALDLLELDGYVSYDPVDARAQSYVGDVKNEMRRSLFPPIVDRAESAHEVYNFSRGHQTPSDRISYAFPEFGLGWRGVKKLEFVCDNLDAGCV